MDVIDELSKIKVIPVVVIKELKDALPLFEALKEGGINAAEVTFRTSCAEEAIQLLTQKYPDAMIGAGTVYNKEQCLSALKAGSKFIVSPCFCKEVFEVCQEKNVVYIPGVVTPTEAYNAYALGIKYLKFFPAGEFGGLKTIKALSAILPEVKFMPTGGVNLTNLLEYVSYDKIFAVGGTYLAKGNREEIVKNCQESLKIVKGK